MAHPRYATAEWKAVRKRVLHRDGGICQLKCSTRCKYWANSVDHVIRPEDGGAEYDETNLVSACISCNTAKRNRQQAQRARERDAQRNTNVRPW